MSFHTFDTCLPIQKFEKNPKKYSKIQYYHLYITAGNILSTMDQTADPCQV